MQATAGSNPAVTAKKIKGLRASGALDLFIEHHGIRGERHEEIWKIQRELEFVRTVYGIGPDVPMRDLMRQQSEYCGAHTEDRALDR
ncbi:hypothetical protein [Microbacterium sp. K2]|uniref:hypothetical protein n=1 Tax=Microbacterium sp. K2 TaxID=3391827 RepID=UPI003ED8A929